MTIRVDLIVILAGDMLMKGFEMRLNYCMNTVLIGIILSLATLHVGAQVKSPDQPKVSILDHDKRLSRKISLEYAPIQGRGFLKSLWSKTGCEFTTIGGAAEFPTDLFTVRAKDVSVRDMMESYACFYRVRWQKTKLGYAILTGNAELEAAFAPINHFELARDAAGLEFVNEAQNLSGTDRNQLSSSIPISSLPTTMQNELKSMIVSLEEEHGANGGFKPGAISGKLNLSSIRLSSRVNGGVTQYNFDYRGPFGSGGFSTTDYLLAKERREAETDKITRTGGVGAVYDPEKYELTQKELMRLDVLKQSVSVNLSNVTFLQVLKLLHEKYKLSVICEDKTPTDQKANLHLNSGTLYEAMKSLEKIYKNTKWIWTRRSFLVVRGPGGLQTINRTVQPEGGIKLR